MAVILPMIFMVVEILSLLFGHTFATIDFLGINFHFIVGVIYFCFGFWVLDIITENYDDKFTDKVIYGKILCQIIFVSFAQIGIYINSDTSQINILQSMNFMPRMILAGSIASLFGYKLTAFIMQKLKIRYEGKFITIRYLVSTLPGEFVFSLVYSFIFLYNEYPFNEYVKIFYSLAVAKLVFSLMFATVFKPATKTITFMVRKSSDLRMQYTHFK